MDYNQIYKNAEQYVTDMYGRVHDPNLVYHNLQHTKSVVNRTKEIAAHYNLVENDMVVLYVAAWFHDTGYLFEEPARHEEKSAELMREFMRMQTQDDDLVNTIEECILATKPNRKAVNLLQQIICDADTYNLGTKEFNITNKLVYEEFRLRGNAGSKKEWQQKAIELLENHQYYTTYCKELLTEKKRKNLKKLKKDLNEIAEVSTKDELVDKQNAFTTKGIQTMLRLTSENHMRLSDMADGKANILISVNAIIISVILSVLLRRLQVDTYLTIPTVIFLAFSVVTIVVAILATRPKVSEGTFSDQDIIDKKVNLLFFGNFHRTSLSQYEQAMSRMMIDPTYLYGSLVKDIFQLGVVLARKYKLIRWAYNIFMFGIIISVVAFGLAVFLNDAAEGTITNSSGTPL
ncbi:Pycsar system effector family protein [Aridibaculum aurantiacum]|uniref:Pycsar system effector family protein n=1 Tax=Aridibaculum aurantiacum TaxID=2810307 RepID=UPI001A956B17|nr:Pycsar system effector family protein [Aridibaculum aurantiacum]